MILNMSYSCNIFKITHEVITHGHCAIILGKIIIIHKICVCVSYKLAPTLKLFRP